MEDEGGFVQPLDSIDYSASPLFRSGGPFPFCSVTWASLSVHVTCPPHMCLSRGPPLFLSRGPSTWHVAQHTCPVPATCLQVIRPWLTTS